MQKWALIVIMLFSGGTAAGQTQTDMQPTDPISNEEKVQEESLESQQHSVPSATDTKVDNQPMWPISDAFPEATGLAMQPPYVLIKLGIAAVGGVLSGLTWVATAGNDEPAKRIWTSTTSGPWTWHEWIKGEKE
jgi:hypothetical protein